MPTPREPVVTADAEDAELKRVVALLLSTQQELFDLRHRRDREHRVLEGMVSFTEDIRTHADDRAYWATVVEASIRTFDCESALVVAWDGATLTVLASSGPAPTSALEATQLGACLTEAVARHVNLVEGEDLSAVTFRGQGLALLMLAALDSAGTAPGRWLVLTVSARKRPFFPQFDARSVPGLRMFASTVAVLHEMHRSHRLIQGQVRELDAANAELERRMEEQLRSAADREQLRAQLAQSRRMESIGRLAGGVAHDFNNLLTVISGHAELIRVDETLAESHRESISEVLVATGRAQALTQQLLMFGRKQVIRPVLVELNRLIVESLRLYRRLIGEDITLTFTACLDDVLVLADRQQFDQLLSNLILNARDAIHAQPVAGRRSEIDVITELVTQESPLHGGIPAVRITVRDTGIGMADEVRQNIFEPFFSTKDVGKGTGLGLATVLGVIQQNQGTIDVESCPGVGTTFVVHWPLANTPSAFDAEVSPDHGPAEGSERITLVEDDEQVRLFMSRGLTRLGFAVSPFSSGELALRHIIDGVAPPDVLVTDVVMPRMNGRQLAEAVLARYPETPVLFVSGYTDDIVAQQGIVRDGMELLQKPFSPAELGRRIRQLLDTRRR